MLNEIQKRILQEVADMANIPGGYHFVWDPEKVQALKNMQTPSNKDDV